MSPIVFRVPNLTISVRALLDDTGTALVEIVTDPLSAIRVQVNGRELAGAGGAAKRRKIRAERTAQHAAVRQAIRVSYDPVTGVYGDWPNAEPEPWADVIGTVDELEGNLIIRASGEVLAWVESLLGHEPYTECWSIEPRDDEHPTLYYMVTPA